MLVRVTLKDGTKQVILLHIEVHSQKDEDFPAQVHMYWSGLHFHTRENVITLVVLADLNEQWHPKSSPFQFGNFRSEIHFETCKLLDLNLDDPNLRGIPYEVARAQLASLRTRNDPQARYQAKKALLLNLYKCGYTADDVREAYGLIDHMMLLNQRLKKQLDQDILEFERKIAMPYVTSMEQKGIEKGIEKVAERMIAAGKSDKEISELTELPLNLIDDLRRKVEDLNEAQEGE